MTTLASEFGPDYRIEHAWRDHLTPVLHSAGFKGSGRHFRRIGKQFAECVSLQGSQSGGRFRVNLGIQPLSIPDVMGNAVDPRKIKEILCEFRGWPSEEYCDRWWSHSQTKPSMVAAAQNAGIAFERDSLNKFAEMSAADSPLLIIDPVSFNSGLFDFRGFGATEIRMARALSLLRLASGEILASKEFAHIALKNLRIGSALRPELTRLAGSPD